jgi:hypothetical protein
MRKDGFYMPSNRPARIGVHFINIVLIASKCGLKMQVRNKLRKGTKTGRKFA